MRIDKIKSATYRFYAPVLAVYVIFLVLFSQNGFPPLERIYFFMPFVSDKLIGEDGYYMLHVAWNIAQGRGISYNFGELTTGIQPLATFFYACIAKITQLLGCDKFSFARIVFLSNFGLLFYFSHLMGRLSNLLTNNKNKELLYIVGFSLSLFNLVLFKHFTYGLETGLYLIFFAFTIIFYLSKGVGNVKNIIILGFLISLTGLCRIDFGIIFFIFFIFKSINNKNSFIPLALSGILALLIISPWFFYVHSITGSWIPSSGGAQSSLPGSFNELFQRSFKMIKNVGVNVIPFIYGGRVLLNLLAVFFMLIFAYFIGKHSRTIKLKQDYKFWLYGVFFLILIYVVLFWAIHFYSRYSSPIFIFSVPILSILIVEFIKNEIYMRLIITFCFLSFFIFSASVYHRGAINNSLSISAGYVSKKYPNKIIGTFQSGVIGYFNSNVYNLDGKLDHEALKYLDKGEIHNYINKKNIEVIIDKPKLIDYIDSDYLNKHFVLTASLSNGSVVYVKR